MKYIKKLFYVFLTCVAFNVNAQVTDARLKHIIGAIDTVRNRLPIEKLYLQSDKPYYNSGDTLRFKAYLLNADFLTPSMHSGMLYIELDNAAGKMVKRIMIPVAAGVSWGDMALNAEEIPEGSYSLRAYTNWMRNFGEDYIFKRNIYISATNSASTLVKSDFNLTDKGTQSNIKANLRFTDMNKRALGFRDMRLKIMNGKHVLLRDKSSTETDGTMTINFDLADKTLIKDLYMLVQQAGKGADTTVLTIPVTINRIENTDLQFMPEGGNLVAGIQSKVGFKAIGEDGKGTDIAGKVYDSRQQEVASFKTSHKGMGAFDFTPKANESYTAKVVLPGNIEKTYPLPVIKNSGTALRVTAGKDSIKIIINATVDLPAAYYLIGQARGIVCYAARVNFNNGRSVNQVAKSVFPAGITRFTLFTNVNTPLNERIVYIDHDDNLDINVTPNKSSYNLRDSIALAVTVKDKEGKPVEGTFSVAVTDNDQVKTDSLGGNILNNFLFTSDLKGNVEEPGWYLENGSPERTAALDNLLLTQGWVGYDWAAIFGPKTEPAFLAQTEFTVEGRVTNVLNKPIIGTSIALLSVKPTFIKEILTDKEGKFLFKGMFPVDTAQFKLQARNKNGKSNNIGIEMLNEFKSPVFTANSAVPPWYVNSDTTLVNNANTRITQLKAEANYNGQGLLLKTVTIKDKKTVKDSKNNHFLGDADLVLDEQDMLKSGKMSLRQLLEKSLRGFTLGRVDLGPPAFRMNYKIDELEIGGYFFDGIDIMDYYIEPLLPRIPGIPPWMQLIHDRKLYEDTYLDYFSAEDIKGIEVWYKGFVAFVEITTRAGKGPWMKITPGTYLYKPLPFTLPKEFYRPRYTVKNMNTARGTDLRSTIHWQPNLITDATGKAAVSFFSADKPTDYTIIVEGIDLNGNIGYRKKKITISK